MKLYFLVNYCLSS